MATIVSVVVNENSKVAIDVSEIKDVQVKVIPVSK